MLGSRTCLFLFLATTAWCKEGIIQPIDSNEQTNSPSSRIVGGQIVSNRALFPYQASLRWVSGNVPFCGASIIDNRNLLTAARCVVDDDGNNHTASSMQAVVGDLITSLTWETTVVEQIRTIFIHPQYNFNTNENDIAVLRINNLTFNQYVSPVPLAPVIPPFACVVSGWGTLFAGGPPSLSLRYAEVLIVPLLTCNATYQNLFPTMLCAGSYRTGACEADTGGPLVCGPTQVGIFSFAKGCGDPQFPGVYTAIPPHLPWIQSQLVMDGCSTLFLSNCLICIAIIVCILTKEL